MNPPHFSHRRDFLTRGLGAAAAVGAGLPGFSFGQGGEAAGAGEDDLGLVTISIFHTTDLHGHILPTSTYGGVEGVGGLAKCMTQIRQWKQENPNHLLLDVGDLYQGTHASFSTEGGVMVDMINALNYDAWVIGNHEFDWGPEPLRNALARSEATVLSANLKVGGKVIGEIDERDNPFSKAAPFLIKEVAGIKLGVVGLTTPGLTYWLRDELLGEVSAVDPAEAAAAAVDVLKGEGCDCIVVAGHMGMKPGDDDYANPVREILRAADDVDVYLAGHTHQHMGTDECEGVLYTQAAYWGIDVGRVDLTFSRDTKRIVDKRAYTVFMDTRFDLDPVVLATGGALLDESAKAMAAKVGVITEDLEYASTPAKASPAHLLIGAAIVAGLRKAGEEVDGVFHGVFAQDDVAAGEKTLADLWDLIPYENAVVTASVTGRELIAIYEESFTASFNDRVLMGFEGEVERVVREDGTDGGGRKRLVSLRGPDGEPVDLRKEYRIAFNSYDGQSGGRRLLELRDIVASAPARSRFHALDTRTALVDFLADRPDGVGVAELRAVVEG